MVNIKENKEINLKDFYLTDLREQETVINIDYYEQVIFVYTCRKNVAERLYKKLGQPSKIYITQNKISGIRYDIPFKDKKTITSILSRPILIGNINKQKIQSKK